MRAEWLTQNTKQYPMSQRHQLSIKLCANAGRHIQKFIVLLPFHHTMYYSLPGFIVWSRKDEDIFEFRIDASHIFDLFVRTGFNGNIALRWCDSAILRSLFHFSLFLSPPTHLYTFVFIMFSKSNFYKSNFHSYNRWPLNLRASICRSCPNAHVRCRCVCVWLLVCEHECWENYTWRVCLCAAVHRNRMCCIIHLYIDIDISCRNVWWIAQKSVYGTYRMILLHTQNKILKTPTEEHQSGFRVVLSLLLFLSASSSSF